MATKESQFEYATLVSLTDKLTLGISSDCSTIAQKLVSKGLITPSFLNSEAVEIFDKVLKAVELNPECYEKFLDVIKECYWMKSLAELIQTRYEEKKQEVTINLSDHDGLYPQGLNQGMERVASSFKTQQLFHPTLYRGVGGGEEGCSI